MTNRQWFYAGLALVALGAMGCGPDISGFCDAQEACLGGNDADISACNEAFDGSYGAADDIGCAAEYNTYFECVQPKYTCAGNNPCSTNGDCGGNSACIGGECKRYAVDTSNGNVCEAETAALSRCFNN